MTAEAGLAREVLHTIAELPNLAADKRDAVHALISEVGAGERILGQAADGDPYIQQQLLTGAVDKLHAGREIMRQHCDEHGIPTIPM
ncbi:hypothetical protein LT337_32120 (plasmid) [Mycolicibacterium fortuitum]|nr:hypothetical protein LT337_32120 [Mycolicibacterium fortuitum]